MLQALPGTLPPQMPNHLPRTVRVDAAKEEALVPETDAIVWWMLLGVMGVGMTIICALLAHYFSRIEKTLENIFVELREGRKAQSDANDEIARVRGELGKIKARCEERHGYRMQRSGDKGPE